MAQKCLNSLLIELGEVRRKLACFRCGWCPKLWLLFRLALRKIVIRFGAFLDVNTADRGAQLVEFLLGVAVIQFPWLLRPLIHYDN